MATKLLDKLSLFISRTNFLMGIIEIISVSDDEYKTFIAYEILFYAVRKFHFMFIVI